MRAPAMVLLLVLIGASACTGEGQTETLKTPSAKPSPAAPSPTVTPSSAALPHGIYVGKVVRIDDASRQMTFRVTDACAAPRSGIWQVPLDGATFSVNSNPETGEGRTDEVSMQDWEVAVRTRKDWEVHYSADGLSIGNGPSAWCDGG